MTPYMFFKTNAGYSYDPATETREQGRIRCARALARAERTASARGYTFAWLPDDEPFECACDDPACESHEPHQAWICVCRDEDGRVLSSLCGISFGPDSDPWGKPYARVVQAELADEGIRSGLVCSGRMTSILDIPEGR